ncbi:hypothetical protein RJZ56_000709, partial [Blastomyces dermatitidis]
MILDTGTENDSAEQEHQRQRRLYTLRHMRGSSEQHRTNDGNNNVTATGAITEASSSPAVAEGSGQGQMDEASRRNRLSTWLRERFRVRTRRHGESDGDDDGGGGA